MKSLHKNFRVLLLVLAISFSGVAKGQDQQESKEAVIKTSVTAHRYIFKAQSVNPTRGRMVQLNSDYDLTISGDTVTSFLPYFGRAYSAPIDPRGGGINFTSTNFEYNQQNRKKGGWDIAIRPKDVPDVREMFLVIFENGTATLRVTSNNRERISFHGFVEGK